MTTVYLIDDDPAMLDLLEELVQSIGLEARCYTRAELFFERVKAFEPGTLLVLDLKMPEMDGIEVMRRLARMDQPPALILISGTDPGLLHAAEKLAVAHHLEVLGCLNKPLVIDRFQQLLARHSRQHMPARRHDQLADLPDLTPGALQRSFLSGEFTLHYQPQLAIPTGKIVGVEALLRWQHPRLGLISPAQFIPLFEQYRMMGELTHWVIAQAVTQERRWQDSGLALPVSANISGDNITSLDLPEQLEGLLKKNALDPTRLTLEVTESVLMGELVTSLDILTRLRLKGIGLSIDDFGTGYSSLLQLHRMPFTELKIDHSFVANITSDPEALAIVRTCILLGHDLDMQVLAEGVEDRQAWDLLADLGCDAAQGYFIARPMPGVDLIEWIANRKGSE